MLEDYGLYTTFSFGWHALLKKDERRRENEEIQCFGCLEPTDQLYVVAKDSMKALKRLHSGAGMCSHCLVDWIQPRANLIMKKSEVEK